MYLNEIKITLCVDFFTALIGFKIWRFKGHNFWIKKG